MYEFLNFINLIKLIKLIFHNFGDFILFLKKKEINTIDKENLYFQHIKDIFIGSIKILIILIVILIIIFFINKFLSSFYDFLFSITGIIELSVITFLYHNIKTKLNAKI